VEREYDSKNKYEEKGMDRELSKSEKAEFFRYYDFYSKEFGIKVRDFCDDFEIDVFKDYIKWKEVEEP